MYNSIMDDEHRTPPSKRLRKFVAGAGMELEDLREKVRKQDEKILRLEEEKKKLEGDKKNLEAEKKELKEQNKNVEKELRGLIECPVCLMAPRERGPVPVCSNGHIVCQTMSAAPAETGSDRRPGRRWPSAPPSWSTWATPPP